MTASAAASSSRKPTTARQRAGQPTPQPDTRQPAQSTVKSLGGPAADPELDALKAEMRAEIESLRQQRAAIPAPALTAPPVAPPPPAAPAPSPLPTAPSDPDIMGLPGIKPLRLTSLDEDRPITRHPLFYIDGVAITVPDEVDMEVSVNYMRMLEENTQRSEVAGQSYLLHAMLGDDGYDRLCNFRGLKKEQLAWIIQVCTRKALGQLETPKES